MRIFLIFISFLFLISCNKTEFKEIQFGNTIIENQTYSENNKLCKAVNETLNLNKNGLINLLKINCGGAAGCYDLGDIIVQIITKIGDNNFLEMTKKLSSEQKNELKNFIEVGLVYGIKKDTTINNWKKINIELTK